MPKKKTTKKAKAAASTKVAAKTKAAKKMAKKTDIQKPKIHQPVPSSFSITGQVIKVFRNYWRVLFGIVAVYLILNIIFASGLSSLSTAVTNIRFDFTSATGESHAFAKGLSGFGSLIASSGASGSSSASVLQSILFIIESLVIIWALRQLLAGKKIGVKEAYYHSMYPLIPFLLVIFVIILQLLPLSFGVLVVSAVSTSAAASISAITWIAWLIFIILGCWSFYMLSSSLFALYIVTLPEMHPREALASAKKLVHHRRLKVIPKILFLPVFILIAMGIVIIPLIMFATAVVAPVFYLLSMLSVLFLHTYLYSLYRSLLA